MYTEIWVLGGLILIYTLSTVGPDLCLSPFVLCPHMGLKEHQSAGHTWQRQTAVDFNSSSDSTLGVQEEGLW